MYIIYNYYVYRLN